MEPQTKTEQPTPEQLLKLLEIQMAASRQRREGLEAKRGPMRIFAIAFIVIGAGIALWVLMYMLEDMRPNREGEGGSAEAGNAGLEISN